MKKVLSFLISTIIIISSCFCFEFVSFADNAVSCGKNATYTLENNVMTITGTGEVKFSEDYIFELDKLIIGEGITSISDYAFSWSEIKEAVLPNTLKSIGDSAFYHIKKINIPDSIEKIGESALRNIQVDNLVLPSSLKEVGEQAFAEMTGKTVTINGNTKFGNRAFAYAKKLETLYVNGNCDFGEEQFICSPLKKVVFSNNVTKIGKRVFCDSAIENIIIPSSVKTIGDEAFSNCKKLKTVKLNEGLQEIGLEAFYRCKKIEEITVPSTVKKAGNAFYECTGIKKITIKNNIVDEGEFFGLHNLEKVIFPKNLKAIKDYGFKECFKLKNINLPNSATSIGFEAFMECENLKSITLPKNLTVIKEGAFNDCKKLKTVKFNAKLKKIGVDAFTNTNVNSVKIPKSVDKIGSHAFGYNKNFNLQTSKFDYVKKNKITIKGNNKAAKSYAKKYGFVYKK